jgi:hypothetical protein
MPSSLLLHLYRAGAAVAIVDDRLEVSAPEGVLTPEIHHVLAARKARLFALLTFADEYRAVLRHAFFGGTSGSATPPEAARDLLDEQTRLIDELGPALADHICSVTRRQWQAEMPVDPWGEMPGAPDDPIASE